MSDLDIGNLKLEELVSILTTDEENNLGKSIFISGWDAGFTQALGCLYGPNPEIDDAVSMRLVNLLAIMNKDPTLNLKCASLLKYKNNISNEEIGENHHLLAYIAAGNGIIKDGFDFIFLKKRNNHIFMAIFLILFIFMMVSFWLCINATQSFLNVKIPLSFYKTFWLSIACAAINAFILGKILPYLLRLLVESDPSRLEAITRVMRRKGINS